MGFFRELGIESKFFILAKVGRHLLIIERKWKHEQELWVEDNTVQWLCKTLEVCLRGEQKEVYCTIREGYRRFLAQRCANDRGRYIVVSVYRGDGKKNSIFIPEGEGGSGWRRMREVLEESVMEGKGRAVSMHGGVQPWRREAATRSYKEVLVQEDLGGGVENTDGRVPNSVGDRDVGRKIEDLQRQVWLLQWEMSEMRKVVGRNKAGDKSERGWKGPGQDQRPTGKGKEVMVSEYKWRQVSGPKIGHQFKAQSQAQVTDPVSLVPAPMSRSPAPMAHEPDPCPDRLADPVRSEPCPAPDLERRSPVQVLSSKVSQKLPAMTVKLSEDGIPEWGGRKNLLEAPYVFPELSGGLEILPVVEEPDNLSIMCVEPGGLSAKEDGYSLGTDSEESRSLDDEMLLRHSQGCLDIVGVEEVSLVEDTYRQGVQEAEFVLNSLVPIQLAKETGMVQAEESEPVPLNCLNPEQPRISDWVFNTVKDIQHLVGLRCEGYEEQFMALLTAIETGHHEHRKIESKKQRELRRLNWSMNS
ncbi:hypothetical protein I3843_15G034500 [Carya illinoinensis]|nr:hypothetical protein I3843_15G034500 [Carya illinoinensis]